MEIYKSGIEYGVMGLLIFMSVLAVGIGLERRLYFKKIKVEEFDSRHELEMCLTQKLHLIATIGSNAPYIGLLGTVLGIMVTFATIGSEGIMESGKIMSSLALALKATAVGLCVAIPSVTIYNLLLRCVKERLMEWDIRNERKRV